MRAPSQRKRLRAINPDGLGCELFEYCENDGMSSTPVDTQRRHPLLAFTGRLHQVLDQLGEPATWTLTDDEVALAVTELAAAVPRLQAHLLRLLAEVDRSDLATRTGAVNTAAWLRGLTRITGPEASRLVKQGRGLEEHDATRAALGQGEIQLAQAVEVIGRRPGAPGRGRRHPRTRPSSTCSRRPPSTTPRRCGCSGKHLLEVVAPDRADELIARQLEREEAEARRTAYLSTWEDGHGSLYGRFKIPSPARHHARPRPSAALANPDRPHPIPRAGRRVRAGVRAGVV